MAGAGGERLRCLVSRLAAVIRVDALWLSTTPLDMRAGTETILARVVSMFGEARPHHAYLFANRRANRLKVLVHDGYGIWLWPRNLITRPASSTLSATPAASGSAGNAKR